MSRLVVKRWKEKRKDETVNAKQYLLSSRRTLSVSGSCGHGDEWEWLKETTTNQWLTYDMPSDHNTLLSLMSRRKAMRSCTRLAVWSNTESSQLSSRRQFDGSEGMFHINVFSFYSDGLHNCAALAFIDRHQSRELSELKSAYTSKETLTHYTVCHVSYGDIFIIACS